MKKMLSKKSGFSLVEILIAFVIFAIFALMIGRVINLTITAQTENDKLGEDLAAQEEALYQKSKLKEYDATYHGESETFNLNFNNPTGTSDTAVNPIDVDYMTVDVDGNPKELGGLNYFIGEVEYKDDWDDGKDDIVGDPNAGGTTQAMRFDTRITGTKGLGYVKIISVTPMSGTQYVIEMCADGSGVLAEDKRFTQYTVFLPEGYDIKYMYAAQDGGFDVRQSGSRGIRVNVKDGTSMSAGSVVKVVCDLSKPLPADFGVGSFGDNGSGTYKPYIAKVKDKDGKETGETIKYDNIYGAYEKASKTGGDSK